MIASKLDKQSKQTGAGLDNPQGLTSPSMSLEGLFGPMSTLGSLAGGIALREKPEHQRYAVEDPIIAHLTGQFGVRPRAFGIPPPTTK